jgi:hypothetical protein
VWEQNTWSVREETPKKRDVSEVEVAKARSGLFQVWARRRGDCTFIDLEVTRGMINPQGKEGAVFESLKREET